MAAAFTAQSATLFDDVIDPVQPEKADEDQIDSHCEAHGPRRDHQEHPRDHGGDRQKVMGTGDVHLELIADSDRSIARRRRQAVRWRRSAGNLRVGTIRLVRGLGIHGAY